MQNQASKKLRTEEELRQELELLQGEAKKLEEMRIRLDSELSRAREEKDKLEKELTEEFGTSNPEQIRKILDDRSMANNLAVDEYARQIGALREHLEMVARELSKLK